MVKKKVTIKMAKTTKGETDGSTRQITEEPRDSTSTKDPPNPTKASMSKLHKFMRGPRINIAARMQGLVI